MKTNKFDISFYGLIFSLLFLLVASARGQESQATKVRLPEKTLEVNIYLLKTGPGSEDYPFGLFAVKRKVESRSPLRAALESLTEGATAEEEARQNLASSTFGIRLVSVTIKNKTAYTQFTMPEDARFSGDGAPFIFIEAVKKTALQFRGVKKVVVCLDGELDFWSEEENAKPKPC